MAGVEKTGDVTPEEAAELYAYPAGELSDWKQAGVTRVAINAWQHVGDSVLIEIRQFRSPVAAKKYVADWNPEDIQYRGTFAGSDDARWFDTSAAGGKTRTIWLAAKGDLVMLISYFAFDGAERAKVLAEEQFRKLP